MASNMTALQERNERVAYARTLGVVKPHTLKREALEEAIKAAEIERDNSKTPCPDCGAPDKNKCPCDPFDEIDPETEGDHLTPSIEEQITEKRGEREATREAWLIDAVELLKPILKAAGATNIDDQKYYISVGFPSKGVRTVVGQCHYAAFNDGYSHLLISPRKDDPIEVLGITAHEMAHMDDQGQSGHTGHFKKVCTGAGLEGRGGKTGKSFTATVVRDDARHIYEEIAKELGPYPHTKLNLGEQKVTAQGKNRQLKASCPEEYCAYRDPEPKQGDGKYTIRLSKMWAEIAMPTCPCGAPMVLVEKPEDKE